MEIIISLSILFIMHIVSCFAAIPNIKIPVWLFIVLTLTAVFGIFFALYHVQMPTTSPLLAWASFAGLAFIMAANYLLFYFFGKVRNPPWCAPYIASSLLILLIDLIHLISK